MIELTSEYLGIALIDLLERKSSMLISQVHNPVIFKENKVIEKEPKYDLKLQST